MDRNALELKIKANEVKMGELRVEAKAKLDAIHKINGENDKLIDRLVLTYTDEELFADSDKLRKLFDYAFFNSGASNRAKKLMVPHENVSYGRIDGRDDFFNLPGFVLHLSYKQDVTEVVKIIRDWVAKFALGRPDIVIGVVDHTLSQFGFYRLHYFVDDEIGDMHEVSFTRFSRTESRFNGNLIECLEYLAEHAYYEGPEPDDEWGGNE